MTHQRISIDPLARITRPHGPHDGIPAQRDDDRGPLPPLPEGEAWVPIMGQPTYNAATQRIERELTAKADGWRVIDLTPEEIRARTVPQEVTRRQLLLVLAGLDAPITRDGIRSMLAGNEMSLIEFDEAQTFRCDHPLIAVLAAQLGLGDETVDQLFIQASAL